MHRSGTSVVARALNLLGAGLGPAEDLMPPKPDNPTGFWETLSVAQLHDDLVAQLGGRWDHPPMLSEGWESDPRLDPFVERIRAIVESHFRAADIAVWKDPRGSLFLPLWRRVVPLAGTVLCVRDPDEVAGSLSAREGIDPERAAALWLRYTIAAWQDDPTHLLVTFDEAYERPRELVRRLGALIAAPPAEEAILAALHQFVDPVLRHYHARDAHPGPTMRLARAAHGLVTTQPRDVVAPFFSILTNGWRLEAWLDLELAGRRALLERFGPSLVELLKRP
jgi:hypothetical protein